MTRLLKIIYDNKVFLVYVPLVIHWISILILTSLPSKTVPEFQLNDKAKHFLAYFVLSFFFTLTLRLQEKSLKVRRNFIKISFYILLFYSTIDELHQLFIPGRVAGIWDWLANFIGIILGLGLVKWFLSIYSPENGTDLQKDM
ncbi:MAG: VanZ family protein [Melioribacteraceae bacterium]|nr:VanZ family protein [Melioribacteraceae bacterium]